MKKICAGVLMISGLMFISYPAAFCWSGSSTLSGRQPDTVMTYYAHGACDYGRTTPRESFSSFRTIKGVSVNKDLIINSSLDINSLFVPKGWMPEEGYGKITDFNDPQRGAVQQLYFDNAGSCDAWTGLYWQYPEDNWNIGVTPGYDLSGATRFTFWVRSKKGTEVIDTSVGGVSGNSSSKWLSGIELSKEWKQYEIDLRGQDMSNIGWGFGLIILSQEEASGNQGEMKIYLDDLQYHFD